VIDLAVTRLLAVSMTATWSALSCATYSLDRAASNVSPRALPSSLMRLIRRPAVGEEM